MHLVRPSQKVDKQTKKNKITHKFVHSVAKIVNSLVDSISSLSPNVYKYLVCKNTITPSILFCNRLFKWKNYLLPLKLFCNINASIEKDSLRWMKQFPIVWTTVMSKCFTWQTKKLLSLWVNLWVWLRLLLFDKFWLEEFLDQWECTSVSLLI